MESWFVYIIECSDKTYYTGITKDIEKRISEHNNDNKLGAKYTRARRPVSLVYTEQFNSRSDATKREIEIKKMSHKKKKNLKKGIKTCQIL